MNYFKEVNFIFFIVGHTKNAADCLFYSLKDEYRRQNLFTFQDPVETLNKLLVVTVHPASSEDFLDYKKLMSSLFWTLVGNIKKNHIFSSNDNGSQIMLRQSNLPEYQEFVLYLRKRGTWDGMTCSKIAEYPEEVLRPIAWKGMNPYKTVELWKNYRPNIPIEYHSDKLYAELSEEVLAKVKTEKIDRSEFWKTVKAKKYLENKEKIESVASDDGKGKV